jgi:predicted hotdog family 3-hydroxylacyl-ACP dehydratase
MSEKPPLSAEGLMPHQPPMRLIDRVLTVGEDGSGTCETMVDEGNIFLGDDGALVSEAMVELMAQAFAAISGTKDRQADRPPRTGYLVGVKQTRFMAQARSGDRLIIHVRPVGNFAGFVMISGDIHCHDQLLACGELKIWVAQTTLAGRAPTS